METREQQILRALSKLQLAFAKDLDKNSLKFYVQMLSDIEPVILDKATIKLINTSKFLPTIAEIRETATALSNKINGTRIKDVDEAWAEVQEEIHRAFVYKKPEFSTPEIAEAVNGMGWQTLCTMLVTEVGTYRAQFRDMYRAACARHKDNTVDKAIGIQEIKRVGMQPVGEIMGFIKER